jgi:hypothetical protein
MKFTALIREIATRDIRVIIEADSKGQALRKATQMSGNPLQYRNGIIARQRFDVTPLATSVEPITSTAAYNKLLRSQS